MSRPNSGRKGEKTMDKRLKMRSCELCGGSIVTKKATPERPYRYDFSGLDNVFLVGIEVSECSRCRVEVPVIPRMGQLHKAIAKDLFLKKAPLTGKEVRYLRKIAGLPAKDFAALLGVNPSHLSRFENGKLKHLSLGLDKLVRTVAAAATNDEHHRQIALALAEERRNPQLSLFGLKKDHWEKLAA
jgi:transcriptional regulator with XRE-family HTH domain